MKLSSELSRASVRLSYLAATAVGALMLFSAASAQAAPVTIGSPLTASFKPESCEKVNCTVAMAVLPESGALITSPVSGTIVRWRILDGASPFKYKLRVLTPGAEVAAKEVDYTASGTSAPETPTGSGVETFPANLQVKAGQTIGLDLEAAAPVGYFETKTATYAYWTPPLPEGTPVAGELIAEGEIAFNAEVQPPPGVSSISPSSGPTAGGTSVVITGHDFAGVSAVKFGSKPAASYTVNSETKITATAPATTTAGAVDTSVTTPAGTTATSSPDRFTYVAPPPPPVITCTVPKLKGKKLKAAKKALLKAECKLGKVKGKKSSSAKVKTQKPKPGTVLTAGSKVSVTVK